MMWLKGCPKCKGDLVAEEDEYTSYVKCLQCGRMLSATEEDKLREISLAARGGGGRVVVLPGSRRAA